MLSNNALWALAGGLFLALTGVAVYKAWPLLFPEVRLSAPLDPHCDLRQGPCRSPLPGGAGLEFEIAPRDLPVLQPLRLQVTTHGLDADRVEVDFQGVSMNMGFNRPRLQEQGEGRFVGTGTLPVCVRDSMEWEARVLLHTDTGLVAAPFRFWTVKPGAATPEE